MRGKPTSTKVYYVKKQPNDVRVYAVLISKHDDGFFYGSILHVVRSGEIDGQFFPGLSSQDVENAILKW